MLTYFGHIILTNGLEKLYKGESSDEEGEEKVVDWWASIKLKEYN